MTPGLEVDVTRSGRRFDAEARLLLAASPQQVWDTITDYDAIPRFMPGIRACRVIKRSPLADGGERLLVEQTGEFRVLLFARTMTVWMDIEQQPLREARARATRVELGPLMPRAISLFEGEYLLDPPTGRGRSLRTLLRYRAHISLALPPPPVVGEAAVRQNLAAQLEAVVTEVARRQAA